MVQMLDIGQADFMFGLGSWANTSLQKSQSKFKNLKSDASLCNFCYRKKSNQTFFTFRNFEILEN